MDDEKLKQELFYMVRLTSKYDFKRMDVVEGILRLENERRILDSVFGRRFKTRIFDIAAEVAHDGNCVICDQPAENQVICNHCMETITESDYAQARIKPDKNKIKFNLNILKHITQQNLKKVIQYILIVCLSVVFIIQLWIMKLWFTMPEINPLEKPRVSSYEQIPVADETEAKSQLALDFPEEEGYTITYGRTDTDYTGRFLIDKGACCEEVEDSLREDQRYDYYFSDDVYVFYISLNTDTAAKVGLAEINNNGAILIMGSFNDGRNPNYRYRFR